MTKEKTSNTRLNRLKESKRDKVALDFSGILGGNVFDDEAEIITADPNDPASSLLRNFGKVQLGRGHMVRELQELSTDEELLNFVHKYFHIRVPTVAVTEGNAAPAEAFCDAFFERFPISLWWASRASSKSFLAGLLAVLNTLRYARCETTILAGSEQQGRQVYGAAETHVYEAKLDKYISLKKTFGTSDNGSIMRVLTASPKSARGPHPQKLMLDEVDEIPRDVFNAAINQPMTKHGVQKQTLMTSTMHKVAGLMGELVENAAQNGIRVYKWNYKEVTQQCDEPDCRELVHSEVFRGMPCPLLGKHHELLTDLSEEDRAYIVPAREYVTENGLDPETGMFLTGYYDGSCQGGLRHSEGFVPVDDQRVARMQVPKRVWEVENECRRPSQEDMVYDPLLLERGTISIIPWDEYLDPERNWAMVDWGFNNPTAMIIAQERVLPSKPLKTHPYHRCLIKEWYWEQRGLNWRIDQIVRIVKHYNIQQVYADGENIDALHALREALAAANWPCLVRGVPFNRFKDKLIDDVRNDMENGHWFISEQGCPNLLRDLYRLHYRPNTEDVAKEDDHGPDAMIAGWRRFIDLGEFIATGKNVGIMGRTQGLFRPDADGQFARPGMNGGLLRSPGNMSLRPGSPVGAAPTGRRFKRG